MAPVADIVLINPKFEISSEILRQLLSNPKLGEIGADSIESRGSYGQ